MIKCDLQMTNMKKRKDKTKISKKRKTILMSVPFVESDDDNEEEKA